MTGTISRRSLGRVALGGLAIGAATSLGACTNLLPGTGEAAQLYVLTPKSTFRPDLPKVDWQLLVDVPQAPAELDTTRIVLSRNATKVEYFANAAWPERAPAMVQSLIVESFANTNRIVAIGRESVGLRADYIIKPELRRFQAIYDNAVDPPTVWVRLNAIMVKMPERAIIAQASFERKEVAARNQMESIVEAFDEALGGTMKSLVAWALTTPSR